MIKEDSERRQITQAKRCIHTTCECSDRYIALIIADSGISIHAAREGGDLCHIFVTFAIIISIHAAREGGDDDVAGFQRTGDISIHAAREGGDAMQPRIWYNLTIISIHAAREGGDLFRRFRHSLTL